LNRMVQQLADDHGKELAQFLNVNAGTPKQARALKVHEICQRLRLLIWESQPNFEDPEAMKREIRRTTAEHGLNQELRKYRFYPSVSSFRRFEVSWWPLGVNAKRSKTEIDAWRNSGLAPISEIGAIQRILELAASGRLDRIRQCEAPLTRRPNGKCGTWFFAMNSKKEVCSDRCRVRKDQHGQDSKKSHKAYMRKYRSPSSRRDRRMKTREGEGSHAAH
jgi:hypothetical protein